MKSIKIKAFSWICCLILLTSCNLSLYPPYSKELATEIEGTARSVDTFYLNMLDKTKAGDRPYIKFADNYITIEVKLNSLYMRNRVRPLNKQSTRNCEIALKIWREYKEDHKTKNDISDGIIKLDMKTMDDIFYTIQVAEAAKQ